MRWEQVGLQRQVDVFSLFIVSDHDDKMPSFVVTLLRRYFVSSFFVSSLIASFVIIISVGRLRFAPLLIV
jgi:hypothetical protein